MTGHISYLHFSLTHLGIHSFYNYPSLCFAHTLNHYLFYFLSFSSPLCLTHSHFLYFYFFLTFTLFIFLFLCFSPSLPFSFYFSHHYSLFLIHQSHFQPFLSSLFLFHTTFQKLFLFILMTFHIQTFFL